jgi:hypothetical protein
VILATIRADTTVASKVDCLLGSTGFTLVCEEAATLVLAGQHLLDFFDFNIAEVIFFRETKSRPLKLRLSSNMCLTVRGTSVVRQRRTMM